MKFSFRFGKHIGRGRLSPEQQSVMERLERDEITAEEARKLLGGSIRVFDLRIGTEADEDTTPPPAAAAERATPAAEESEEEIARRLVERIAQEVDAEDRG